MKRGAAILVDIVERIGRESLAESGADAAARAFGDDLAAAAARSDDGHPVETGERAQLARSASSNSGERRGRVEPGDHPAHGAGDIAISMARRRFGFEDDLPSPEVWTATSK